MGDSINVAQLNIREVVYHGFVVGKDSGGSENGVGEAVLCITVLLACKTA